MTHRPNNKQLVLAAMLACAPTSWGENLRVRSPGIVQLPVTEGSEIRFERLKRSQGLSPQRVTRIVQDDRGFMWFGTGAGLSRLDARRKLFRSHSEDDGLPDERATSRGPWSEPGLAVVIKIQPAWWATWWSKTLFAIVGLISILLVYYLRVRQLQQNFLKLLKARESERARIARDLHDSLFQGFQPIQYPLIGAWLTILLGGSALSEFSFQFSAERLQKSQRELLRPHAARFTA
jgi:hypothetical protein